MLSARILLDDIKSLHLHLHDLQFSPTATTVHRDGRTSLGTCIADTPLLGPAGLTISLSLLRSPPDLVILLPISSPSSSKQATTSERMSSHTLHHSFHLLMHHLCSTARGIKVAQLRDRLAALGYSDKAEVIDPRHHSRRFTPRRRLCRHPHRFSRWRGFHCKGGRECALPFDHY